MFVRSIRLALLALLALAAAAPAGASAATLLLDKGCYISEGSTRETMAVTAAGFTPGAPLTITANGQSFGNGTVNADGTLKGTLRAPTIGGNQSNFRLKASDGVNTAEAKFVASRLTVDIFPRSGRPSTWRTRFSAYGLVAAQRLLQQTVRRTIYAHWIKPGGRIVAGTKRAGVASGLCGKVVTTRQRAFPFGTQAGTWIVQFDANRTYKRSEKARVRVALKITRFF